MFDAWLADLDGYHGHMCDLDGWLAMPWPSRAAAAAAERAVIAFHAGDRRAFGAAVLAAQGEVARVAGETNRYDRGGLLAGLSDA